jgi:predicted enzyme related to lactoylglutathione lyase
MIARQRERLVIQYKPNHLARFSPSFDLFYHLRKLKNKSTNPQKPFILRGFIMITKTTHLTLFVKDQDEALKFYTEKLGFKLHTDAMMPNNERWVTIHPAQQKDFEFALMKATTPAQKALIGKQAPDMPLFCVSTDNCRKMVENFKKNDVKVIGEIEDMPWGVSASFQDLYGNNIYMVEPK